ncbi:MAG TPA: S8 family serine peptidase, partial [Anaerolineae bacterium]|nr:S8 family serine peptidase [Anaerolineae bacterium]
IPDLSWRNHGTAVLGEMIANDDGQGVTGICPGADVGTVSIGSMSTAEALMTAADNLQPGDAILIELHAPGPHYNFQSRPDQLGYVCMEYWQANFDAIQYCWASGLVVVEAGGNGAENFDNATYYGDLFDTTYRNSHAIIVGAGHPAVDFNDLERESFSNYGERVNLQGYGSDVYTTGYGGLYNGSGVEDSFYTATFSGTSSASPIVTGAVACLQGRYKQIYGVPMTVDQIRKVLVSTGTPQMGNLSEHIGPRPDLEAAFANLNAPPSIYTTPLLLDTTMNEGNTAQFDVWLHNRHTTLAYDFSINDNDSLAKIAVGNWLTATPLAGTIPPLDSIEIDVTFD